MRRKIKREDIVHVGLELMFLNGYHATGIKEITQAISIPKGSFYNHFNSKEEFGLEVLQTYCDNGIDMYKSYLLDVAFSPLERLKRFFSYIIKGYETTDYTLGCLMGNFSLELSDVNENFRVLLDTEFDKCESLIVQCLDAAVEQGELTAETDTKSLGACILNNWHGALIRMKSTGSEKPLNDFYTLTFHQILKPIHK